VSLYFGCKDQAGHYVWGKDQPYRISRHEGGWVEFLTKLDGILLWSQLPEGLVIHAQFNYGAGNIITVIGFNDYSVDSRPGSVSMFLFEEHLTKEEALRKAREDFPWVFARLRTAVL
jgi:hypothetical protein